MKLTTQNGQLDLPRDFSLIMERTNPLLSGEGDASVPVTLPSSTVNLAALGHRERIDRAERYINKVDAILEAGPVQKRGQLVIDSAHRRNGIDAVFAIDNGDLYARNKEKTLKEIFAEKTETFNSVESACNKMFDIYNGNSARGTDYMVFPVAVAPYEKEVGGVKAKVYQYNNEIRGGALVWQARNDVHEGDVDNMSVPDGYGVAPFLKLSALVNRLFAILGYEVKENCLEAWPFARMVVVHNCSDCLCNLPCTLYYKDLVPSCTLNEFLGWLNDKFHVQPVVDSEARIAKIVCMETMLTWDADCDITEAVEGDFTVQLVPTKRVVLSPENKIEGSDPAAATFDKLIEKYGSFDYVNEVEFHQYPTATPPVNAPLVLRRATGQFYAVELNPDNERYETKLLGTNHFTYDRNNSEEAEEHSPSDSIPPMIVEGKVGARGVMPFIGDRLHAHTSYNGSTADDAQDIIVVQAHTCSAYYFQTTGTTQRLIYYANCISYTDLGLGTTPYDLYEVCWNRYNTLLLNAAPHLKGRVLYTVGQLMGMDMTRLKHCNGQNLLPVSASGPTGIGMGTTEAEFILAKTFADGITDTAIVPASQTGLVWKVESNILGVVQELWLRMGGGPNFGHIDIHDTTFGVASHWLEYGSHSVEYLGDNLQPGIPERPGEVKRLNRQANITIHFGEIIEWQPEYCPQIQYFEGSQRFENITVTFTFTAVQP